MSYTDCGGVGWIHGLNNTSKSLMSLWKVVPPPSGSADLGGGRQRRTTGGEGSPLDYPGPSSALSPTSFGAPGYQLRITSPPLLSTCFFNYLRKGGGDGYSGDKKAT